MLRSETDQLQFAVMDDEPDESEIYNAAVMECIDIVSMLWDSVGKEPDAKRVALYYRQLQDLPLGLLEIGVNYAIANNTYATVPTVGKVFEGVRKHIQSKHNTRPGADMDELIGVWLEALGRRVFYEFK